MNTESAAARPSDPVRAEAAAWIARLHGSGRTRSLEAGLRKWLKADPAHARAFEIATEAWEIGGSVRNGTVPRMADPFEAPPRRANLSTRRRTLAVAAAMLVVAVAAGWAYWANRAPAIVTAVGEQRILTLTDGTRISLNTDTRLFVRETENQRRVELESGEALFDVAQDPRRPFVVAAGDREVAVLGTSFVVRRDPRQVVVTLVAGKVAVTGAASNESTTTTLLPGQRVTFVERSPPRLDAPSLEKVTAWRRGEVVLDKTRLRDAVDEMNRYSAVKIHIADDDAADIPVSGIFRAGDSVRFARAVGETYHLSVEEASRRIRISRPR